MGDWSPAEELRREHEAALSGLRQLRSAVEGHSGDSGGTPALPPEFTRQLDALRNALLLHFRKEEQGLYPDVRKIVAEGAPEVDILGQFFGEAADDDLTAHHLLRARMREARDAAMALGRSEGADASALSALRTAIHLALDLLARHAEKESAVVFPMVVRLLDESQMAAAGERMRAITTADL